MAQPRVKHRLYEPNVKLLTVGNILPVQFEEIDKAGKTFQMVYVL